MSYRLEDRKALLAMTINEVVGSFEVVKFQRLSKAADI